MLAWKPGAFSLLLVLAACGESDPADTGETSTASGESEAESSTSESSGPDTGTDSAETTSGDGDGDSGDGDGDGGDGDSGDGDSGDGDSGDGDGDSGDGDGDGDGDGSSQGCGLSLAPGTSTETIQVNGATRGYELSIPANYDPNSAYPLVFAWHGQGGDGQLARLYYGIEEASSGAAIFVYPDGLPVASANNETGWALGAQGGDMDFFEALLAHMRSTACIDDTRIFSAGHSFGSYMSNALACNYPDELRAIGGVAGGPSWWPCASGGDQVAAWLAHDPSDQVVGFASGTQARDQYIARNNCDATSNATSPNPCVAYEGCDAAYPMHWCEHSGGGASGHNWPGFAGDGIWNFFASF